MNKQMEYRKQIETIEEQLTKENKEYMGRVNGYMMVASIFHRKEEEVTAQLLSIYQDVFDAQQAGQSAEDFLGKDSKQMADELLSYLPAIGFSEVTYLSLLMLSIFTGIQLLTEFSSTGSISINWISLLCDVILSLLLPAGALLIIRSLIYQTSKVKIWVTYISFPIIFLLIMGLRFWLVPKEPHLMLTGWAVAILLSLFSLVLLYFRKEKLVRYIFLPTYILMIASGVLHVYMKQIELTVPNWLSIVLMIVPFLVFWLGSIILLLKKKRAR